MVSTPERRRMRSVSSRSAMSPPPLRGHTRRHRFACGVRRVIECRVANGDHQREMPAAQANALPDERFPLLGSRTSVKITTSDRRVCHLLKKASASS